MAWWSLWREEPARASTGEPQVFDDGCFIVADDAVYVGPDREKVRWDSICSIDGNKFSGNLNIYQQQFLSLTRKNTVTFKDCSARNFALAALARRLAPRFSMREVQYGALRAGRKPLLIAVAVAAFTGVSVPAAWLVAHGDEGYFYRSHDPYARVAQALIPVFRLLGPAGVAVVGALAVLGCLAWMVARIARPPVMITLTPSD
jgi:hypothetical protein